MFVSFLVDLLDFILHRNFFVFDTVFYRQIAVTVMGARFVPSSANLFLGWNIKLTHTISKTTVEFLDLRLRIKEDRVVTSLFRKSTATNSLLHFSSFHPGHAKTGIPTGQFGQKHHICM